MGLSIQPEYITDMEKIMAYGVMSMPALVVNEKVVSMGKVLKAADVEKLIHMLGYLKWRKRELLLYASTIPAGAR